MAQNTKNDVFKNPVTWMIDKIISEYDFICGDDDEKAELTAQLNGLFMVPWWMEFDLDDIQENLFANNNYFQLAEIEKAIWKADIPDNNKHEMAGMIMMLRVWMMKDANEEIQRALAESIEKQRETVIHPHPDGLDDDHPF